MNIWSPPGNRRKTSDRTVSGRREPALPGQQERDRADVDPRQPVRHRQIPEGETVIAARAVVRRDDGQEPALGLVAGARGDRQRRLGLEVELIAAQGGGQQPGRRHREAHAEDRAAALIRRDEGRRGDDRPERLRHRAPDELAVEARLQRDVQRGPRGRRRPGHVDVDERRRGLAHVQRHAVVRDARRVGALRAPRSDVAGRRPATAGRAEGGVDREAEHLRAGAGLRDLEDVDSADAEVPVRRRNPEELRPPAPASMLIGLAVTRLAPLNVLPVWTQTI